MPAKGQTGWHHSLEARKKMSNAAIKRYAEGLIHWNAGNPKNRPSCFEGRQHSEESKALISEHRKGKAPGNKNAEGHTPHNKGKKHPVHDAEWRRKVSEANAGPNHWNWQGGISGENMKLRNSAQHKEWSLAVLAHDFYSCTKCGYRGRQLIAHHVIKWSVNKELRFDVSNGITLCRACHCELHKPRTGTGKPPCPN